MSKIITIGHTIRRLRIEKGEPLRTVAAYLDIDQAILSKIETGKRQARRSHIIKLANYFKVNREELIVNWLSSRILHELQDEELAGKAIQLAEEQIAYRSATVLSKAKLKKAINKEFTKYPAIEQAWLFGSYARGDEAHTSDIDLMLDVPQKDNFSMFDVFQIQEDLQIIFNRNFDIVMKGALKSFAWETAKKDLKLIYDKSE